MLSLFRRQDLAETTPLSRFVRDASSEEKRKVYAHVIQKAATEQRQVMDSAQALRREMSRRQTA
ncbi:MAG: hypothetical protein DI587_14830 [Variovorax paradoxus]|nr:MAG: hypothetical protein DI583_14830 [Variovorax paradoxus]PZQ09680.1 MAG: hypothetical protein DI587_14830 [Variovorax paradoxus]